MKKDRIKTHLAAYSIVQKRTTTINHAFASAIAPWDKYADVEEKLDEALTLLGQDPESDLSCVYCDLPAETWDHLVGLVEKSEFRGYGHQLGNLVPCCKSCNSAKGAKDWYEYLGTKISEPSAFESRANQIKSYLDRYSEKVTPGRLAEMRPDLWKRYSDVKQEILALMKQADGIADGLREAAVVKKG